MKRLLAIACALSACLAGATTYYVDASRPDNSGNGTSWAAAKKEIQAAVDLCSAGDTVLVTNGVYSTGGKSVIGTGAGFTNRVVINLPITVRSVNGPDYTSISGIAIGSQNPGANAIRAAFVTNGACLAGFSITNSFTRSGGSPTTIYRSGGGIFAASGAIISNCVVYKCKAFTAGGGIFCDDGTVLVVNCRIFSNAVTTTSGGSGGGVVGNYSVFTNCEIAWNTTANNSSGGGAYSAVFFGCNINSNLAGSGSGSSYGGGCVGSDITDCRVVGNTSDHGGGIADMNSATRCVIMNNLARINGGAAGGVYDGGTESIFLDCTISSNSATTGGGIFCALNQNQRFLNCTISSNSAVGGAAGGAYNGVLYSNCTIFANTANYWAGIVAPSLIVDSVISNNISDTEGGGICHDGSAAPTLAIRCRITQNSCVTGSGAGVEGVPGYMTLEGCVIDRNYAAASGGGAYNAYMYACTVASNEAAGDSGGILNDAGNGIETYNCIIDGNTAPTNPNMAWQDDPIYNSLCPDADWYVQLNGSINASAQFVNLAAGDYRVQSTSRAIGHGLDLSGTHPGTTPDIAGTTRTAPWTIGALQYVAGGPVWTFNKALWNMQVGMMFMATGASLTPYELPEWSASGLYYTTNYTENSVQYFAIVWTNGSGSLTFSSSHTCDVLVVGGGGGTYYGGGGGGGDVVVATGYVASAGSISTYVGAGGTSQNVVKNGQNSTCGVWVAYGGGRAGSKAGNKGGSTAGNSNDGQGENPSGYNAGTSAGTGTNVHGGGASYYWGGAWDNGDPPSFGGWNNAYGGGGGAGEDGHSGQENAPGAGGNGIQCSYASGVSSWYGGGGGGAGWNTAGYGAGGLGGGGQGYSNGGNPQAAPNTGGGAGGAASPDRITGGSGIVVVRWAVSKYTPPPPTPWTPQYSISMNLTNGPPATPTEYVDTGLYVQRGWEVKVLAFERGTNSAGYTGSYQASGAYFYFGYVAASTIRLAYGNKASPDYSSATDSWPTNWYFWDVAGTNLVGTLSTNSVYAKTTSADSFATNATVVFRLGSASGLNPRKTWDVARAQFIDPNGVLALDLVADKNGYFTNVLNGTIYPIRSYYGTGIGIVNDVRGQTFPTCNWK